MTRFPHSRSKPHSALRAASIAAIALALAACADAPSKPDPHSDLAKYQAAAGAPVDSMPFMRLDSWQPLDEKHLVVWTDRRTAWLIEVWPVCNDLVIAPTIGLTSSVKTVYANVDKVLIPHRQSCQIGEIRPIDLGVYKRAREAERAAQSSRSGT